MSAQTAIDFEDGFSGEVRAAWRQLPDKGFFFLLLAAWLGLFHFLGNSTLGYVDTPSLFGWMLNAYNSKSAVADDSFGNFIPLLVLGLFWWKRQELLTQPFKTWWPGLLLVTVALVFHLAGSLLQQTRLSIVALFLGIYGLMGLAWGPRLVRASFFPFFLFAFMVPLGSMTERIAFPLQMLCCKIVAFFCTEILGITVNRVGTQLFNSAGTYQYEVAAACSGIRSLVAIGVISIVYAFTSFQITWKRVLLVACALPLAVVGNVARLFMIVMAGEFLGQAKGNAVHESAVWSMVPYVPAILGLILIGRWLEDRNPHPPRLAGGLPQPATPR